MRNVIFAINITMDGCRDHTKVIAKYFTRLMGDVDLQVFGRKTYQLMVPYWPEVAKDPSATKADREFAEAFDSVNKLVIFEVSRQRRRQKYENRSDEPSRRDS